ncbi:hypothetical protein AYJ54_36550 [Bradyrhizobium centrolobii]|uniref:Sel1 repeat protein n=1 Tax=Bradyrhizobium centrolobii TaxID=1505087 RepID=A0A176Y5U0_9BRAD|nr:hypothetical protein [Bradyrhizobium centrolobii]OAE96805.1 hypothetical protein AYJ54_36550 [Bradyrhizobium centrolobii]
METTAYRLSSESRALDADQTASYPPAASYIRTRARRADLSPDDPIPLFLSDPLSAPDPREFEPLVLQTRARILPRVLAAVLGVSAAAILVTLFQPDVRSLIAANASALMSAAPAQAVTAANPPAALQTPLKDPTRVANTTLASADTRDVPAPSTPSREAIATAYQTALQAQAPAPVAAQPAPASPPPVVKTLDADTLAGLMARAKSLLGVGDIVAARLLLERAAYAQDATAAFMLAQTYDPAVLGTKDTRSITPDLTAARDWYQKAAALGSAEARQRLAQFQN